MTFEKTVIYVCMNILNNKFHKLFDFSIVSLPFCETFQKYQRQIINVYKNREKLLLSRLYLMRSSFSIFQIALFNLIRKIKAPLSIQRLEHICPRVWSYVQVSTAWRMS